MKAKIHTQIVMWNVLVDARNPICTPDKSAAHFTCSRIFLYWNDSGTQK